MRKCEVDFIGKIIAAVSHEFMNTLATIRESSGLMEDLFSLDNTDFPYRDRLIKSFAVTRKQISRGMEIGENLNAFAHNMDAPKQEPEINALLLQIVYLMDRFARLKQIRLKFQPAESPLEIETDPFQLQLLMAKCVECCLKHTTKGGVITLHCRKSERSLTLGCEGEPLSGGAEVTSALDQVTTDMKDTLRILGAELSSFSTGDRGGFEMTLPYLR